MAEYQSNQGWRHYWREDRLAACVPDNADSAAAIETHWAEFFSGLPAATRVLDVATGNGVLLVWAARAARSAKRELTLTGIDLADIDPVRYLPEQQADLAGVCFVGGTAAESLPFPKASFDVVVSQYGLEYADLDPALSEVARVLAPGGQLHWLAHSDDSRVIAQGRARLIDINLLLASDGPFAAMKRYVEARTHGRRVSRATRVLTEALRAAEAHCAANQPATLVNELCGSILNTANQFERYHPADVELWLEENRQRLRGQKQRTHDLLSACLSGERVDLIEQTLGATPWSGVAISTLKAGAGGGSVGQLVRASKFVR